MYQLLRKLLKPNSRFLCSQKFVSTFNTADISSEVLHALEKDLPIVALESTIITHGMPYPKNMETALELEDIVRNQGAVPATIAIMKGQIKVGLNKDMIGELASSKAVKTSRRDFPYVMSKQLNGGTTVAGTLVVANRIGIHVFATGGIGGVHRGGEQTMDISADLIEIGKSPVAVVCSGVKSILDIEKTLEYLETQGVMVVTYGKNKDFPAFYSSYSGFSSPYNVETTEEAAQMLHSLLQGQLNSGMLLAVPVPEEFALSGDHIERAIQQSLKEAENNGIKGKDVTPYVLEQVCVLTSGKSLDSNIALVRNNAKVAAQLAVNLKKLPRKKYRHTEAFSVHGKNMPSKNTSEKQVVFVGGSVLDCVVAVSEDIKTDGRTLRGRATQSGGGVGRNLADALGRMAGSAPPPLLVTTLGDDQFGRYLLAETLSHLDTSAVEVRKDGRTACYTAILDKHGECHMGIGDMSIHDSITPSLIRKNEQKLKESCMILMDGNIPQDTMELILELAKDGDIPVWFEPTDVSKSIKPFRSSLWKSLYAFSPNLNELKMMAREAGFPVNMSLSFQTSSPQEIVEEVARLGNYLVNESTGATAVVTLGRIGVAIIRRGKANEPFYTEGKWWKQSDEISARLYPAKKVANLVNVMGAGDCLAAGFIRAMLLGLSEERCAAVGLACANAALNYDCAVPIRLLSESAIKQTTAAEFLELY